MPTFADGSPEPNHERLFSLSEAWNADLTVGDVIHGLHTTDDYNTVEVLAAEHFEADLRDAQFMSLPLAAAIRPPKFQGELRNGVAIVAPTDLTWLNQPRIGPGHALLTEADVLSFLIHADAYSSGRGMRGQVTRLVTYFLRSRGTTMAARGSPNHNMYGKIGRKLWPAPKDAIGTQLNTEARERAQKVMAFALRHMYGGGLPG